MQIFRYVKVSVLVDAGHGADLVVEQFEQAVVVLADDLDEQVERAGHDHEVVDLGERGDGVGGGADVALDADADHGHAPEPERHRVGDGHDLGDTGVDQAPDPLADRGFRQPDLLRRAGCREGGRLAGALR